jgi:hypothetical protein
MAIPLIPVGPGHSYYKCVGPLTPRSGKEGITFFILTIIKEAVEGSKK